VDAESDLMYYRARYYDPAVGRFVSEDPLGFAAGDVNVSRYVGNGATNATDPSGMQAGAPSPGEYSSYLEWSDAAKRYYLPIAEEHKLDRQTLAIIFEIWRTHDQVARAHFEYRDPAQLLGTYVQADNRSDFERSRDCEYWRQAQIEWAFRPENARNPDARKIRGKVYLELGMFGPGVSPPREDIQGVLKIYGAVPVAGAIPLAVDAGIHAYYGEYEEATYSAAFAALDIVAIAYEAKFAATACEPAAARRLAPNSAAGRAGMELMDGSWVPSRPANPSLIPKLKAKGWFIDQGATAQRHLDEIGALGRHLGDQRMMLPQNPKQLAVLEEFVHGTQAKIPKLDSVTGYAREIHVKDFMIRHRKLLGLTEEEVGILTRQRNSYRVLLRMPE
jgi:RHS repeat-associated protein